MLSYGGDRSRRVRGGDTVTLIWIPTERSQLSPAGNTPTTRSRAERRHVHGALRIRRAMPATVDWSSGIAGKLRCVQGAPAGARAPSGGRPYSSSVGATWQCIERGGHFVRYPTQLLRRWRLVERRTVIRYERE